ncbi:hypothetical protein ABW20_dc0108995 [Dactylellina cionopaga]|nr:hypothetical protein ABW20_dc0108995 [Dactylellina cionopaga]
MAVPYQPGQGSAELPSDYGDDVEKTAPANFNPSPNKGSIFIPVLKRRVAKKTFWIICGCVGGVILIAIIVGVAVGVSKSKRVGAGVGGKGGKAPKGQGGSNDGSDGSDPYSTSTDTSDGGDGSDNGSSSTNPCQDLVDSGAPYKAISDCLYQKHLTNLEIINNSDSSSDYEYVPTSNPYASSSKRSLDAIANSKKDIIAKEPRSLEATLAPLVDMAFRIYQSTN